MKVTTSTAPVLLVFLATISHSVICSTFGNDTDRLSLLEFKNAVILDPQKSLISWNESTHFCRWEGVSCSSKNPPRVTAIDLSNRGLVGLISPSLGNLTFLRNLSLATNRFTGQIPESLGHLRRLQSLYLSNNSLQGIIPSFANCSDLRVIWLDSNELTGGLPRDLPLGLEELILSLNNLVGTIPSTLGNITLLNKFICMFNSLDGASQAILNMSSLVRLDIDTNHFRGKMPSGIGSSLPNLRRFFIGGNFFQGSIPSSLANASNLDKFPGTITTSYNNLHGSLPNEIFRIPTINQVEFAFNNLNGELPTEVGNAKQLRILQLSSNNLSGDIPNTLVSLGDLELLQELDLAFNNLSAHVGDFGLARLRTDSTSVGNSDSTTSVAINGTIGYVAPECAVGGQVSTASDVYSFGVILLEIFIRRRPTDEMFKDGLSIAMYTEMNIPDKILQIIDPQLVQELGLSQEDLVTADENAARCLLSVMSIGLCCTKSAPSDRISMQEVSAKLHAVKDSYLRWY
nr:unnamed protein product [Digitaria exilis]